MDFASCRYLHSLFAGARRAGLVALLSSLFALQWSCPAAAESPSAREYEIKAAFIYNFTKFVEWPGSSFPDDQTPFVIGVLGDSPCAEALERLASDHKVGSHNIQVRRIASARDMDAVQILFVGSTQETRFGSLAPALATAPVLTVGESPTFASMGGTINFVREDNKLRFEINLNSAKQAGIRISAQLLKLATAVKGAS
jgi:hypothetical protein